MALIILDLGVEANLFTLARSMNKSRDFSVQLESSMLRFPPENDFINPKLLTWIPLYYLCIRILGVL